MPAAPSSLPEESQPPAWAPSSPMNYSLPGHPPASMPPRLKLRPRPGSNGHDPVAGASGFSPTLSFAPHLPPSTQHGIHAISLSARGSSSKAMSLPPPNKVPLPAPSATPSISGGSSFSSPIKMKKQKTQGRLELNSSTDASSPSDESEDSRGERSTTTATMGGGKRSPAASPTSSPGAAPTLFLPPPSMMLHEGADPAPRGRGSPPVAPATVPTLSFPSVASSSTSSHGKRSLPTDDDDGDAGHTEPELSSPFTPRGRQMMQNLSINSPSPALSLSPDQLTANSRSHPVPTHQQLPSAMTFSFSPSLKLGTGDCTFPSKESRLRPRQHSLDARETIVNTAASTPLGTPKIGPMCDSTAASSTSSPFHPLLGQRAPIGHHRGSVFKMPPQRTLYPKGRDDASSSSLSGTCGNALTDSSHSSPWPSPRIVPLTVLSRDGSPVKTPKTNMPGLYLPSPLIRLLDQEAVKEEQDKDASVSPNTEVKMPNVLSVRTSPATNQSHRLIPRIKLTPRSKDSFLLASPSGDLSLPRLMQSSGGALRPRPAFLQPEEEPRSIITAPSSLVTDSPGTEAAAEMDSLLTGFGHHGAANDNEDSDHELNDEYALGRVESEEAEMVALTQDSLFQMPTLWLPPSAATQGKHEGRRSASTFSDGDLTHFSPGTTFNLGGSVQSAHSNSLFDRGPSFLPQHGVLSIPQTNSCSLSKSPTIDRDPVERIIRADAITEAARSEEPLTYHDGSNIDGDDENLLLCLPRNNQANHVHSTTTMKNYPSKSSHVGFLADSPSRSSWLSSRSGSLSRRSSSLASSPAPTVYEEGSPTTDLLNPIGTQGGDLYGSNKCGTSIEKNTTFRSDCYPSDIMASSEHSRSKASCPTKDRLSVCSMMSTSSLCGLDILHEASLINQGSNKVPVVSQSKTSEYPASAGMFRTLRSELSLNSLGLSVDSPDAGPNQRDFMSPPVTAGLRTNKQISPRDLCTPPVLGGMQTSHMMLSPPPLRCRTTTWRGLPL